MIFQRILGELWSDWSCTSLALYCSFGAYGQFIQFGFESAPFSLIPYCNGKDWQLEWILALSTPHVEKNASTICDPKVKLHQMPKTVWWDKGRTRYLNRMRKLRQETALPLLQHCCQCYAVMNKVRSTASTVATTILPSSMVLQSLPTYGIIGGLPMWYHRDGLSVVP